MNELALHAYRKIRSLIFREEGQDLVEYALIIALIVFSAAASMQSLAGAINLVFVNLGATIDTYIS